MSKVVCFGEILLRLNPEGYLRINQASKFDACYVGAEANVAVSLTNYGHSAKYVTVVPDNLLGISAINSVRHWGVDTTYMYRAGNRLGIYFIEKGASQRPSKVVYDRRNTAIAMSTKNQYDWEKIFEDADWFHFTGITPALSPSLVDIILDACEVAKKKNVTISCDLNYRETLWSREEARISMTKLVKYADLLITNEQEAADVFGIEAMHTDVTAGVIDADAYKLVAKEIVDRFGCKWVGITLRSSISANDNLWAGMLYDGVNSYFSKQYPIRVVDRVGAGDSFVGGLIYSLREKLPLQEALDFAVAASCLKHTIETDFNHVYLNEVRALMEGDGSGRVQR